MRQIWIQTKTRHQLYLDQINGQTAEVLFHKITDFQTGDILYGTVKQVDQRLKACFIDVGQGQIAYLPYRYMVEEKVSRGDWLLVQIERLATSSKYMTVTTKLQIKDDTLVYSPFETSIHVSHKLTSEERSYLIDLLSPYVNEGLIVRTKANQLDQTTLINGLERLKTVYKQINEMPIKKGLAYRQSHPFITALQQADLSDVDRIIVDEPDIKQKILSVLPHVSDRLNLDRHYLHHRPYGYESLADELTRRQISLPSGATLMIDQTEALTAVDVDFGSYRVHQQTEPDYMVINREAVTQLAKSLKERNIYGAIIVDLLNMKSNDEQQDIINVLKHINKQSSASIHIVGFTKLGMLELTRKREVSNSYQFFGIDQRTLAPTEHYFLQQLEEELCWFNEDRSIDVIHLEVDSNYSSMIKPFLKLLHETHKFHFPLYISAKKGLQSPYQLYKIGDAHWLLSRYEDEALSIDKAF
ncbi:ribonuclease E/G [Alkalibacillus sp. S2W]|uniref:ribonuclease E/G n=1 Tax=Alkalibacillus sp. S2W TaxID=3386553 RepID=UPI00398C8F33